MQYQTEAFETTESADGVGGSNVTMTPRTWGSRRQMMLGGWSLA
jgi:hypothetical protein